MLLQIMIKIRAKREGVSAFQPDLAKRLEQRPLRLRREVRRGGRAGVESSHVSLLAWVLVWLLALAAANLRHEALGLDGGFGFELVGQIEPIGPWTDFLNAPDKHTLPMCNTRVLPISAAPGSTSERAQVFVLRSQVQLIHLPERAAHETIYMLKHAQIAICHVGPLICRGEFREKFLADCEELGALMAAGLDAGVQGKQRPNKFPQVLKKVQS